jgi:hypothetical protein
MATGRPSTQLTQDEIAGLRLFIGEALYTTCHMGPLFTNGEFHNNGVPRRPGLPEDDGRASGAADADPLLHAHRRDRPTVRHADPRGGGFDGGRAQPAGNGPDQAAGRRAARWLHSRLCLRDVLHAGELRSLARVGLGLAPRTHDPARRPLPPPIPTPPKEFAGPSTAPLHSRHSWPSTSPPPYSAPDPNLVASAEGERTGALIVDEQVRCFHRSATPAGVEPGLDGVRAPRNGRLLGEGDFRYGP